MRACARSLLLVFENRLIFNPLNLRFYHESENIKDIRGKLRKRGTRSYAYPKIEIAEIHTSTYPDVKGFLCASLILNGFSSCTFLYE